MREIAKHHYFSSVGFGHARFAHDLVAAKIICLELNRGPVNVKNTDLNRMYNDNQEFDFKSADNT